ncbi:ABC transporter permease [Cellulomonas sp. C5510]|uniref:ABC transporter permease n=1 Tax=Cellulomonas sp. C5510 TaxID=2871170 RepID=UPI001C94F03C|nr:ABC transporter permease [Cellulomonas sp. C5510]QZN86204.1 ABC transporter permease [Cellulomonas sp. C5510]
MSAALRVEALKLRRATAAWVAALAVVLGVPALSAGLPAAARANGDSLLAAKVAGMVTGTGWDAVLALAAQVVSIGALLASGVLVSWCFGRELAEHRLAGLTSLPVGRDRIAWAKTVVLLAWGAATVVAAAAASVVAGVVTGLGAPGADELGGVGRVLAVGMLSVLLAVPLSLAASALRGYLPGVSVLLGIVVVTQVVTLSGAGAWFPWAAPGMWAGMGGPELARSVTPVQLALPVAVAAASAWGTARWWRRAPVI